MLTSDVSTTIHTLEPDRETVHGSFSRDLAPVLTVESGDLVRVRTIDAGFGLGPPIDDHSPRPKLGPRDPERDNGPALCGPIAVRGAKPGDVLEIRIEAVVPGTWGWTWAAWPFGFNDELNRTLGVADSPPLLMRWNLDTETMTARNQLGHGVNLRPFLGTIGVAPAESGWHSGWPPRSTGGNMDCKELIAGSTLYLPIAADGGLLSVGDGHGRQGDGEVSGVAIECPMERVDLRLILRDDLHLRAPRAHTPAGWITFGFDEDLNVAADAAMNEMLDLMQELHGFSRPEALALASLVVDLRITQIVNGVRGVHAVLPPERENEKLKM